MSTPEQDRDFIRMRHLAQQSEQTARSMGQNHPVGSPEDATSEFAINQAELNQIMVRTFTTINGRLEVMSDQIGDLNDQQKAMSGEQKAMSDQLKAMSDEQKAMRDEQKAMRGEQKAMRGEQKAMRGEQKAMRNQQEAMLDDIAAIKRRQDTMSNDIGQVKGGHARAEVAQEAGVIALDMGLGYVDNVPKLQLAKWAQENSNSGIDPSDLRSFREADLVVEATDGPDTVYIAVEVSFTANQRDVDRAQRNAEFLERFTGRRARAAIASVKNDDYVDEQVDKNLVHWHRIERRSLEPD